MTMIYVGPIDNPGKKPVTVEGEAGAAILPGTVLKQTATGLAVNDSASTVAAQRLIVADKDQMRTLAVTQPWTSGENMVAFDIQPDEFANVRVAVTQNITTRGTPLSLNGSGLLVIGTPGTDHIIAFSDEIVNTTGGDAAGTFVLVKGA